MKKNSTDIILVYPCQKKLILILCFQSIKHYLITYQMVGEGVFDCGVRERAIPKEAGEFPEVPITVEPGDAGTTINCGLMDPI